MTVPRHARRLAIALLWATSLLLVSQRGHTQTARTPEEIRRQLESQNIISGDNVGVRVELLGNNSYRATLMVRQGGRWVAISALPASANFSPLGE